MISARQIITLFSVLTTGLIFTSAAFAQGSLPVAGTRPPLKTNIQGRREETMASRTAQLKNTTTNRDDQLLMRKENEVAMMTSRIATREENIKLRMASEEAFLKARNTKIAKMEQTLKVNMATREAALKAKLQVFRDKTKAQLTQSISQELNKINQNRTAAMNKNLAQLSEILTKINNKANEATPPAGTPDIQAALNSANTAIQTAQTAIDAQSARDYTVIITSEATVKSNVQEKRDQLVADLKTTQQKVVDAKQALVSTYSILRTALGEGKTNGQ